MVDDVLAAEEIRQFHDVIDVVAILNVVGLVYHADVVEDVVLPYHELKQNDPHGPNVRLVRLMRVMQDRFQRHVGLRPDLIPTDDLQALR